MKLAIATIFYQSLKEIERLIQSIPSSDNATIDSFIWIDGIFKYTKEQNPQLPDLSDYEVIETIIDGMKDKPNIENIFKYKPNTTEFEKRNTYLETCKEENIDYLIIADSDEFFIYDPGTKPERSWELFRRNFEVLTRKNGFRHNIFSIRTLDIATNTKSDCPRCWYNPAQMRYIHGSHYFYANIETEQKIIENHIYRKLNYCAQSRGVVKGLTLAHSHDLRTNEQLQLREQYQKYLVTYESLIQNGYSHEKADKIAKANPSKDFNPT